MWGLVCQCWLWLFIFISSPFYLSVIDIWLETICCHCQSLDPTNLPKPFDLTEQHPYTVIHTHPIRHNNSCMVAGIYIYLHLRSVLWLMLCQAIHIPVHLICKPITLHLECGEGHLCPRAKLSTANCSCHNCHNCNGPVCMSIYISTEPCHLQKVQQ